jgi:hypothetical protein
LNGRQPAETYKERMRTNAACFSRGLDWGTEGTYLDVRTRGRDKACRACTWLAFPANTRAVSDAMAIAPKSQHTNHSNTRTPALSQRERERERERSVQCTVYSILYFVEYFVEQCTHALSQRTGEGRESRVRCTVHNATEYTVEHCTHALSQITGEERRESRIQCT